jgi:hypothetical protein
MKLLQQRLDALKKELLLKDNKQKTINVKERKNNE